jgi:hypothetical protein
LRCVVRQAVKSLHVCWRSNCESPQLIAVSLGFRE